MIDETAGLEPPTSDDRLIWDVWLSVYHFPTLAVADGLGVFSLLKEASASSEEVAERLSLGPRATEALLGVLTSLGFLEQRRSRFYLTDVARNFLLPDSPYYWGGILDLVRDIPFTCSSLREALKKDKPIGYEGDDIWETHELDPEQARLFTRAMHSHSFPAAMGVARRGNFTGVRRLLDVAGGSGCFCIALAQRYPEMRFTVAELPVVCRLAEEYVAHYGLQDRIDTASLDMFSDPWPSGYDAHFLSNIFHDWNWEHCRLLARQSFESLPSGGRIYLHEMLLEDTRDAPLAATSFSMNMIFFTQGKQFTAGELEKLLGEAGFEEIALTPTNGYYSLVIGRKL
jgi:O-methyltransferase domain/Dimerisation domain